MPQRKNNTTLVTEDVLVEAVVARVSDKFNEQLDLRFGRLERLFESGAAPRQPDAEQIPHTATKRPADRDQDVEAPAPKRPATATVSAASVSSHSSTVDFNDARPAESIETLRLPSQNQPRSAILGVPPPSASGINKNNQAWEAWLAEANKSNDIHSAVSAPALPRPFGLDNTGFHDQDLDAQVCHILETAPHQLKGNIPHGVFPFKYVTRGPEKKKLSFNTLSLPEHILGMFRIIEDDRVDPSIKPEILNHMKEVAEDSCEFEWGGHVRRWSEEVFDLVAEGRLPGGWAAHSKIQNLRTGMSQVDSARISSTREPPSSRKSTAPSYHEGFRTTQHNEVFKGGPPCPQFNGPQGCTLPSGHTSHGKKQIHVCSYCLANTAAAHPHSEAQCRTKQRHAASHF